MQTIVLDQHKIQVIMAIQIAREQMQHGITPRYNPARDFVELSKMPIAELEQLRDTVIEQWCKWKEINENN